MKLLVYQLSTALGHACLIPTKIKTATSLLVLAVLFVSVQPLLAIPKPEGAGPPEKGGKGHRKPPRKFRFKQLDTDKDGTLTLEEFRKSSRLANTPEEGSKRIFNFLDRNKDGKLQERELLPPEPPKWVNDLRKNFVQFDKDGDGALNPKEFRKATSKHQAKSKLPIERVFKHLDRNKDHAIQRSELKQPKPLHGGKRKFPPMDIKKYDANKSGGLDFTEFAQLPFLGRMNKERRQGLFKRIDADGNGEISPKEVHRAHQRPQRDRPPGRMRPPSDAPPKKHPKDTPRR